MGVAFVEQCEGAITEARDRRRLGDAGEEGRKLKQQIFQRAQAKAFFQQVDAVQFDVEQGLIVMVDALFEQGQHVGTPDQPGFLGASAGVLAQGPVAFDAVLHRRDQPARPDRLAQEIVATGFQCIHLAFLVGFAGQEHNRDVLELHGLPDHFGQLDAAGLRHVEIHQNQVGLERFDVANQVVGLQQHLGADLGIAQNALGEHGLRTVVLDNQHPVAFGFSEAQDLVDAGDHATGIGIAADDRIHHRKAFVIGIGVGRQQLHGGQVFRMLAPVIADQAADTQHVLGVFGIDQQEIGRERLQQLRQLIHAVQQLQVDAGLFELQVDFLRQGAVAGQVVDALVAESGIGCGFAGFVHGCHPSRGRSRHCGRRCWGFGIDRHRRAGAFRPLPPVGDRRRFIAAVGAGADRNVRLPFRRRGGNRSRPGHRRTGGVTETLQLGRLFVCGQFRGG